MLLLTALIIVVIRSGGMTREGQEGFGLIILLCLLGSVIGFCVGLASFDRRSHNPGYLWFGVLLNAAPMAIWILAIIVGLSKR
jgi:hypothetical protein